jgi:23S rRNA (cytosine1962-C5)-methyltransferase
MDIIIKKIRVYELIDSGQGEKLERFGDFTTRRPDPEALWSKKKSLEKWQQADFSFIKNKGWSEKNKKEWIVEYDNLSFIIKPTSFKHLGLFPEQIENWKWMDRIIRQNKDREISVLNLFAYTGGASLVCARAGASVCHLDASKSAVLWAKENAKISNLEDKPIRWIVDDVMAFLKREIKRGKKYDAIIMDPPAFGHGPKDELWKIEENFLELMDLSKKLLSDNPLFFLINGYTAGYSATVYENNLKEIFKDMGVIEKGELLISESNGERLLPSGIYARFENK